LCKNIADIPLFRRCFRAVIGRCIHRKSGVISDAWNERKYGTAASGTAIIERGVARVVDIRRLAGLLQIRCICSKNGSRRSGASGVPGEGRESTPTCICPVITGGPGPAFPSRLAHRPRHNGRQQITPE
jgi:hypothetical protein